MNKKTVLRLSAVLFVLIATLACSNSAAPYGGPGLISHDSSALRADVPLPPFPWAVASTPGLRADVPLPPFPWAWSSPTAGSVS
jgi:hypothetical protein